MTLILKSNQIVNDPDNRFPIVTDMGEATVNVYNYKNAIEQVGGSITQQEFDSLNILDKKITELGLQDAILDMNLAVGSNLNSKLIKFKGWKTSALTTHNSFDDTNIDGKGFVWNTPQGGGARALGLGFTINDVYTLNRGIHSIIYAKYNSEGTNTQNTSWIYGAGSSLTADNNSIALFMQVSNGQINNRILNAVSSSVSFDLRTSPKLISTAFSWSGSKSTTFRALYDGQSNIAQSTSSTAISIGSAMSQEVYLGANNATSNTAYNFFGQIGLAVFINGEITAQELLSLSDALDTFIQNSGKSY